MDTSILLSVLAASQKFLLAFLFSIGKPVGTICHGAWMLCSAKCIKDKRVTCFHAIKDDVENAGCVINSET